MDGLIALLIVIGIISKLAKKDHPKKKTAASSQTGEKPAVRQNTAIPFSRDEWAQYLKQAGIPNSEKKATNSAGNVERQPRQNIVPGQVRMQEFKPAASERKPAAVKKAVPTAARPALLHDEPEGTISTQGESRAEHAAHRRRILEEEARLQQEKDALEELRSANLQKLRSAVVMSEVLGKPVALRGKRW